MAEKDVAAAADWDEERSRLWLETIDARERQLETISDALFEHAALAPGERVLDIGCGSGSTTARAAGLVAPEVGGHPAALEETGRVVGVDVSPAMIAAARERYPRPAIEWLVADAQSYHFAASSFDVVISRFGTMFFADPAVALANLAVACRPGGRLTVTVWQRRSAIPYFAIPLAIVLETLDRAGARHRPPPAEDAGPFSMSSEARVRELLTGAGWTNVACTADDRPVYLGGPGEPSHAVETAIRSHVVQDVLADQPSEVVDDVRSALLIMAQERHDGAGVPLHSGIWIVTAMRPG
jgi:SAM-dependent methyltransferase